MELMPWTPSRSSSTAPTGTKSGGRSTVPSFSFDWIADVVRLELERQLENEKGLHAQDVRVLQQDLRTEQITRISAQRGLVPYVRSLEQFDRWLLDHSDLRNMLRPILQE